MADTDKSSEQNQKANQEQIQAENQKESNQEKPRENAMTKLYDKLPFTLRQVDIFVKVMLALILCVLAFGIIRGNMG